MSLIYGNKKSSVLLKILENQQQNNGYDCGLFAIANLVEFCFNDATYSYKNEFVLNKMREHLIHCLERGEFSKFPQETICKNPALKYKII